MNAAASTPSKVVFESEQLENIGAAWRARETYEIISVDEFTKTFELSGAGKDYQIYSQTHFKRTKR
jgi:hypothetical protein